VLRIYFAFTFKFNFDNIFPVYESLGIFEVSESDSDSQSFLIALIVYKGTFFLRFGSFTLNAKTLSDPKVD